MRRLLTVRVVLTAMLVLTTFVAAGPRAFADSPWNSNVTLFLKAGDANAIAACLNIAKQNGGNNTQANQCRNKARASGGNVVVIGAEIDALQTSSTTLGDPSQSNLAFTASGGSATAIATCVNVAGQTGRNNKQVNRCTNLAVAIGGDVVLVNVNITGVQLNP